MAPARLRRDLGLVEATTIVVGSMIGSGIFVGIGGAAALVPDGPLLLLVFALSGALVVCGALTLGEVSSMLPESGGHYAYIREAYGRFAAYLQGWNIFTIAKGASVSALAVAFANYVGLLLPLPPVWGAGVVAVVLIAVLTVVNVVGVRFAGMISNVSTFAKLGGLLILIVAGAFLVSAAGAAPVTVTPASLAPVLPTGLGLVSAFGAAMVFAMFAYDGWANSAQVAEEVRDPLRNVPRSLILGVLIVMIAYLGIVYAYVHGLGIGTLAAGNAGGSSGSAFAAADLASRVGGPFARTLVVLLVLVSIIGTTNAVILSGPRIPFAMARDGLAPKKVAEVHPRWGTPAWAIVAQSVWAAALALVGTFNQLLTLVIFTSWIFYGLGAYITIHWRRTRPYAARPYRTPGWPVVPWVFVIASALFTLNTLLTSPMESAAGLLILAVGLPGYWYFTRGERNVPRPAAPADGRDLTDGARALEAYLRMRSNHGLAAPDSVRAILWDPGDAAHTLGSDREQVGGFLAELHNHGRVTLERSRSGLIVDVRAVGTSTTSEATDRPMATSS
ncbi:MAG: APC family permease [Thermoplasmatota archaeon]